MSKGNSRWISHTSTKPGGNFTHYAGTRKGSAMWSNKPVKVKAASGGCLMAIVLIPITIFRAAFTRGTK